MDDDCARINHAHGTRENAIHTFHEDDDDDKTSLSTFSRPLPTAIILRLINLRIHDVGAPSQFQYHFLCHILYIYTYILFLSHDNSTSLSPSLDILSFYFAVRRYLHGTSSSSSSSQNEMAGQLTMRTRHRGNWSTTSLPSSSLHHPLPPPLLSRIRPMGICFAYI